MGKIFIDLYNEIVFAAQTHLFLKCFMNTELSFNS